MIQKITALLLAFTSFALTDVSATWTGAAFSWNITNLHNETIEKAKYSNDATLRIPYNVSDQYMNWTIYEKDCLTEAAHIIPIDGVKVFGADGGFRRYDLELEMNQTLIEPEEGTIWYPYNNVNGTIRFCVRGSLWLTDSSNVTVSEVYFLETNYTVFVDKTEGFNLTNIELERTDATDKAGPAIDYDADLATYQCDENNNYAEIPNPPALVQGDFLVMCVESISVIEVQEILELSLTQEAIMVGTKYYPKIVFDAIDDAITNNALVATGCTLTPADADRLCWIKIQLIANYFVNPDPLPITADGTVTLNVAASPGARRLNEPGSTAEGNISMEAGLSSAESGAAAENEEESSASSVSGVAALAAALVGGAAFVSV